MFGMFVIVLEILEDEEDIIWGDVFDYLMF